MCENDPAVDAWFSALQKRSLQKMESASAPAHYRLGHMAGVIRELAATVPGVREWLMENLP